MPAWVSCDVAGTLWQKACARLPLLPALTNHSLTPCRRLNSWTWRLARRPLRSSGPTSGEAAPWALQRHCRSANEGGEGCGACFAVVQTGFSARPPGRRFLHVTSEATEGHKLVGCQLRRRPAAAGSAGVWTRSPATAPPLPNSLVTPRRTLSPPPARRSSASRSRCRGRATPPRSTRSSPSPACSSTIWAATGCRQVRGSVHACVWVAAAWAAEAIRAGASSQPQLPLL